VVERLGVVLLCGCCGAVVGGEGLEIRDRGLDVGVAVVVVVGEGGLVVELGIEVI
jgi:hypothetical protein